MSQIVISRSKPSKLANDATTIKDSPGLEDDALATSTRSNLTLKKVATRIRRSSSTLLLLLFFLLFFFLSSSGNKKWFASVSMPTKQKRATAAIPQCEKHPWKPKEDLVGECGGSLKPHRAGVLVSPASSVPIDSGSPSSSDHDARIHACASECCALERCVAWQYRRDVGCLHGGDVRLGMEKDGPGSWCHHHPPKRWSGQYVVVAREETKKVRTAIDACSSARWNPQEQPGQCFGLGDVRGGIQSSLKCMEACCSDETCGAWQFHADLGCFYHTQMYGCIDVDLDPVLLEPFVGRRKQLSGRTYTDANGQPWSQ